MSRTTEESGVETRPDSSGPRNRWWTLAVVGTAQLMVVLDATIVNIALPSAQHDLGFSNGNRQWIVTAYSLAFGSLLLLGGRIADLAGRKSVFLVGLAGFAAASAVGGAAGSFAMLVTARAAQGLFGALLAPAVLSLLTTAFTEPRARAKAFGIFGAIAGTGGAVGLLLGGILTEYLDWRWCLYVNVAFAALALLGGARFLGGGRPARRPQLDLPGALLASSGLFCIVYGFSNAESHAWGSPMTWGFLAAGGIVLALFVLWQPRSAHPLLPLRIVLDGNRAGAYTGMLVAGAGMFGVFLFLTYYLQEILGYSPVTTGCAFLPMVAVMVVTSVVTSNRLIPRLGGKPVVPVGMALAGAAMLWMTTLDTGSGYAAQVLPMLLVSGLGLGMVISPSMNFAAYGVGADDAGVASAMVNTSQQIGGSVGTSLLNTLATTAAAHYLTDRRPTPQVLAEAQIHSFSTAYRWSALFFAVGLVLTALLYRRGAPEQRDEHGPVAL